MPALDAALRALGGGAPAVARTTDLARGDLDPRAADVALADLARQGETLRAIETAMRLHGLDATAARRHVEALVEQDVPRRGPDATRSR